MDQHAFLNVVNTVALLVATVAVTAHDAITGYM
jgi:hypothetical protein